MMRVCILLLLLTGFTPVWAQSLKIYVHLDTSAREPLTGRLYVFFCYRYVTVGAGARSF